MFGLLEDLIVVFGLGVAMVILFHRLNLPSVLGFLVTGVITGPFGLKLVDDVHAIEMLAEIGLVLLLFEAGIEFSVKTFLRMRRFLLIAGSLQLLLTIAVAAVVAHFAGLALKPAIFIGMLTSLSSTALVIRLLEYRGEIDSIHGRAALGILIFQDLCIVPLVLITPYLGEAGANGNILDIFWLTGKALLFVVVAGVVARFAIPWFLGHVARLKKREAFVLSIMLLCLGTAYATSHFGLSMALGAFIAGLVISDSKYSHQALAEVLPIREVLNCLVFVSIGMLFDVRVVIEHPVLVLVLVAALVTVKTLTGFVAVKLSGHSWKVALVTSLTIAQASEFAFVISKLGYSAGILDHRVNQLFLATAILSMFFTPAFMGMAKGLERLLGSIMPESWSRSSHSHEAAENMSEHVVVVGYGDVGKSVASALAARGQAYVVVDFDPVVVRAERGKGTPVIFGDASRPEVLKHAGTESARMVVITLSDSTAALKGTELARRLNASVPILSRARRANLGGELKAHGANLVIADDFESGAGLTEGALKELNVPEDEALALLSELRSRAP